MCIGRRFAENELHILVAKVIKQFFFVSYEKLKTKLTNIQYLMFHFCCVCVCQCMCYFQFFRKYKIEYNYGKLTYKVNPTYIPEQPLKFKLTERQN